MKWIERIPDWMKVWNADWWPFWSTRTQRPQLPETVASYEDMVEMVEYEAASEHYKQIEESYPKWWRGVFIYMYSMWPLLLVGNARYKSGENMEFFCPVNPVDDGTVRHVGTCLVIAETSFGIIMGTWSFTAAWLLIHLLWGLGVHCLDVRDWSRKNARQLEKGTISLEQLQEGVIELIVSRLEKARMKIFGEHSVIADRHSEIRVEKAELIRQREYFKQRVNEDGSQIAHKALAEVMTALEKLEIHESSLQRNEGRITEALAKCEARLPRVRSMLQDKMMVDQLQKSVRRVEGIGQRINELVPEAMSILAKEFGRIDLMLNSTAEKAMALPMPDLAGDDIKAIMGRVAAEETAFAEEFTELENAILFPEMETA